MSPTPQVQLPVSWARFSRNKTRISVLCTLSAEGFSLEIGEDERRTYVPIAAELFRQYNDIFILTYKIIVGFLV